MLVFHHGARISLFDHGGVIVTFHTARLCHVFWQHCDFTTAHTAAVFRLRGRGTVFTSLRCLVPYGCGYRTALRCANTAWWWIPWCGEKHQKWEITKSGKMTSTLKVQHCEITKSRNHDFWMSTSKVRNHEFHENVISLTTSLFPTSGASKSGGVLTVYGPWSPYVCTRCFDRVYGYVPIPDIGESGEFGENTKNTKSGKITKSGNSQKTPNSLIPCFH